MPNPPSQYASDLNLRARQRLWQHGAAPFDLIGWVLGLADVGPLAAVLDLGCGHGAYLDPLADRGRRLEMRNPSTHVFSLENGAAQVGDAFASVRTVRPEGVPPVVVSDAEVVADDVASVADHYEGGVDRPWAAIAADVRREVGSVIAAEGAYTVRGEAGAFVCT